MSREEYKLKLLELFKSGKPIEPELDFLAYSSNHKQELLWAASDLAKEGWISESLKIARHYAYTIDENEAKLHQDILEGEEVRLITTVRGTVCWVLLSIISKLDTAYFHDILDLLEGDEDGTVNDKNLGLATGENLYVRTQAVYPLELLVANMKAVKNADGSPFDFGGDLNRLRAERLAFKMFEENKKYPRVMEVLASVFNRMRYLRELEAITTLRKFLFNPEKSAEYNPDYVLVRIDALAIFFAEFRTDANDGFNPSDFVSLLKRIIKETSPTIRGSIVWHMWKTCEENSAFYEKFQKYIPIIFEAPFDSHVVSQLEFLVETIINSHPNEGVQLYENLLEYCINGITKPVEFFNIFLTHSEKILPAVLKIKPEKFSEYLNSLLILWDRGVYIGNPSEVLTLYKSAPPQFREEIKKASQDIYEHMKIRNPQILTEIEW